jgi:hypothetical protein
MEQDGQEPFFRVAFDRPRLGGGQGQIPGAPRFPRYTTTCKAGIIRTIRSHHHLQLKRRTGATMAHTEWERYKKLACDGHEDTNSTPARASPPSPPIRATLTELVAPIGAINTRVKSASSDASPGIFTFCYQRKTLP